MGGLQTEYEFTLPKGYVDQDGTLHRKGVMRLANAKDEIEPLTDYRVQKNRAYMVILILSRVITRLGTLKGEEISPEIVEELFSADLSYLQDFYRRINEDGATVVEVDVPEVGKVKIDLGTLEGYLGE